MSVFIVSIDVTMFEESERASDLVVIHKVIYFQDHRIGSSVSAMSEKINKSLSCTKPSHIGKIWTAFEPLTFL